jgi:hypothetical protein
VHAAHQVVGLGGVGVDLALEVADDGGVLDRYLAQPHPAGGAVDRDDVALLDDRAAGGGEAAVPGVDLQLLRAADAGLAHAAGDDGGVRGLAAAAGEHALGGDHPGEVVGVGLPPDEHHLLAAVGPLHGLLRGEHRLADGGSG